MGDVRSVLLCINWDLPGLFAIIPYFVTLESSLVFHHFEISSDPDNTPCISGFIKFKKIIYKLIRSE